MKARSKLLAFTAAASIAAPGLAQSSPQPLVTRVYMAPACIVTEAPSADGQNFFPGLAAIVVPVILGYVIDAVVADLQKIRKTESTGSLALDLYRYDPKVARYPIRSKDHKCVTIITGRAPHAEGKVLTGVQAREPIGPDATLAQVKARLTDNGIKDFSEIFSIFEAELTPSTDGTAFRYEPRYYRLDRLLPGDRRSRQGIAYNLSLLGPAATPNGAQYTSAVIQIGEVSAPLNIHFKRSGDQKKIAAMRSGYILQPGMTMAAYGSFLRHAQTTEPAAKAFMPAVFRAQIVQTIKPSDVAKVAATILSGAKPGLVAAAGKELTPTDAAAERQKVLNAKVALRTAEAELAAAIAEDNAAKIAAARAKIDAAEDLLASLND